MEKKSLLLAFVLTFLFGPLGLLYASIVGGIILIVLVFWLIIFIPYGTTMAWLAWPISVVWSMIAISMSNDKSTALQGNSAATHQENAMESDYWQSLIKFDDGARAAVELLKPFGISALNELATAHQAIGDNSRLPEIADKIAKERASTIEENNHGTCPKCGAVRNETPVCPECHTWIGSV